MCCTTATKMMMIITVMLSFCHMFHRMLRKDKEEVEAIKHAKALEAEKAMYSVRSHLLNLSCTIDIFAMA